MSQKEITFFIPDRLASSEEFKSISMPLMSVPRVGELVCLDVRFEGGQHFKGDIRVIDVQRMVKFNPRAGMPTESFIILTE